jgi:hypothetical protein
MKVKGGMHSEFVAGKQGGVAFRGHKGLNVVSGANLKGSGGKRRWREFDPRSVSGLFQWGNSQTDLTIVMVGLTKEVAAAGDLSGNNRDLITPGALQRMILETGDGQANGFPFLRHTGVNNRLRVNLGETPLSQPFTIFQVGDWIQPVVATRMYWTIKATGQYGVRAVTSGGGQLTIRSSTSKTFTPGGNQEVRVWEWVFDEAESKCFMGGAEVIGVGDAGVETADVLCMNGLWGGGNSGGYRFYEWLFYGRLLNQMERAQVTKWLQIKYGL